MFPLCRESGLLTESLFNQFYSRVIRRQLIWDINQPNSANFRKIENLIIFFWKIWAILIWANFIHFNLSFDLSVNVEVCWFVDKIVTFPSCTTTVVFLDRLFLVQKDQQEVLAVEDWLVLKKMQIASPEKCERSSQKIEQL